MKPHLLLLALATLATPLLHAEAPRDPIGSNLFPPDFVMANADAIRFTDEQRQALQALMEKVQPRFVETQEALQRENDALGKLLAERAPDQAAVLAQFEKLLDRERIVKRLQLTLMLDIREKLTADQRARLAELHAKNPAPQNPAPQAPPASLQEKSGRVQNAVARWTEEGRDLTPIAEIMNQVDPLMRVGKFAEVEALLDQALKLLGAPAK